MAGSSLRAHQWASSGCAARNRGRGTLSAITRAIDSAVVYILRHWDMQTGTKIVPERQGTVACGMTPSIMGRGRLASYTKLPPLFSRAMLSRHRSCLLAIFKQVFSEIFTNIIKSKIKN